MTETVTPIVVRAAAPGIAVIELVGDVTGASETALTDAWDRAAGGDARAIILNFEGLEYMNSSGIGLLVTLLVRANRMHQQMMACGLSEHYRQILELTRLDEAISIHETEAAAISAA